MSKNKSGKYMNVWNARNPRMSNDKELCVKNKIKCSIIFHLRLPNF